MYIYILLILYWLICYISLKNVKNSKLITTILMGIGLFLIMGLRSDSIGVDTKQYLYRYENSEFFINYKSTEFGFNLFNYVLYNIGITPRGYIIITSAIISISFSIFFYRYSPNIFISFFLHLTIGIFSMSMSGLRQTIAICITLFAFDFIIKKKAIRFIISILIAYSFHNSSICFLPLYILNFIDINKIMTKFSEKDNKTYINKYKYITLIILSVTAIIYREKLNFIINLISPVKYQHINLIDSNTYVNPLLILISIAITLVSTLVINKKAIERYNANKFISIIIILSCINIFINILSLNYNLIGRISFYFSIYNMILIPFAIKSIKDVNIKTIAYMLCIVLPTIQFFMATVDGTYKIDDYRVFWNEQC